MPDTRREERGRTWNVDTPGPRRFHALYLGLPKTGSTSLAEVFARSYRSGHEYRFEAAAGVLKERGEPGEFLQRRDAESRLELDSATFLHFWAADLVDLFPAARFLVFERDFPSWLGSLVAMMVRNRRRYGTGTVPRWQVDLGEAMFGRYEPDWYVDDATVRAHEDAITADYQRFWTERTAAVRGALVGVPSERKLVLPTSELSASLPRIADFLGVDPATLDASASHRNAAHSHARQP